jgi:hypothetical protein
MENVFLRMFLRMFDVKSNSDVSGTAFNFQSMKVSIYDAVSLYIIPLSVCNR